MSSPPSNLSRDTPTPPPQTPPPMSSQATVPDSPPGSKRPADAPDSEIAEMIHKAKASRFMTPPAPMADEDESLEEILAKQLVCSICTELYVHPVLCLPCSHSFCGSCAARWLQSNNTCPACRGKVVETTPNTVAAEMAEVLLKKFPDKARPADELEELKALYKPGDQIMIYIPEYSSEEEDEEDDEEEEENWMTGEHNNAIFAWAPCPTCPADNPHGYHCPDPIPQPASDRLARHYGTTFRSHVKCSYCENPLPTGWKTYKCDVCNDKHCGNMFECQVNQQPNYIAPVSDQIHAQSAESVNWRNFNSMEKARVLKYIADNDIQWDSVCQQVFDRILRSGSLRGDQNICLSCATTHFELVLMHWWITYQEANGIVDDRVKCWYGYGCRTQMHNENHAARLNHACIATPEDQRVSNAPPRNSVSIPHPAERGGEGAGSAGGAGGGEQDSEAGSGDIAPSSSGGGSASSPGPQVSNDS